MKVARWFLTLYCVIGIIILSNVPASALNIVLTNDDGFESNNIQALFNALKAVGHDVIMSAPYLNQSGSAGAVNVAIPIKRTKVKSSGGLFSSGVPGLGPTTIAADQYYVNGSPVDAVLYGIDILAVEKWGQAPDLVISGPNSGNNVGLLTPHSGTVGAAIAAINRGIPAIAVSTYVALGAPRTTPPEEAQLNAQLTVRLVAVLEKNPAPLLPLGYGLNVNLPELDLQKPADAYNFALTQIGLAAEYGGKFYTRLKESSVLADSLAWYQLYSPGVGAETPYTKAGYAEDDNPMSEFNVLQTGIATISMMQGTYQAQMPDETKDALSELCNP